MKTITLYKAFVKCRDRMESAISIRPDKHLGIAIDKDDLARWWQRRNRLAIKLERWILQRLEDIE